MVVLSKARSVFAVSTTRIVGSNPTRGMDVCVYSLLVLSCVEVEALQRTDGVLPTSEQSMYEQIIFLCNTNKISKPVVVLLILRHLTWSYTAANFPFTPPTPSLTLFLAG
jgi:hypothetical protein